MTGGPPWTDDARWITIRAVVSLVLAWPLAGALMLGSVAAGGPAHGRSLEVADVAPGAAAAVEPGASPGCADGDRLLRGVSRRLGRDAATAAADAGVAFAVDDSGPPTSPAIEVTFSDRAGRPLGRRLFGLAGSSCPAALDAAAVAVTLFLQDRAAERDDAGAPQEDAAEAPAAAPVVPSLPVRQPPATLAARPADSAGAGRRSPWSVGARGGCRVDGGDVPWGTWGVEATVRVRHDGWPELFAGATFWPQQRFLAAGVDLSWTRAGARAGLCPLQFGWESRALAMCAAVAGGRLSVTTGDLTPSYRQDRWTAGADAALGMIQRLHGSWVIGLEARLVVPFLRNRVDLAEGDGTTRDLFRATLVGAAGTLSLGYSPGSFPGE